MSNEESKGVSGKAIAVCAFVAIVSVLFVALVRQATGIKNGILFAIPAVLTLATYKLMKK